MRSSLCTMLIVGFILPTTLSAQTPLIDYHQHLFRPDAAALVTGNPRSPGIGACDVIALLDCTRTGCAHSAASIRSGRMRSTS